MKKILVTGAGGFIGSHLVERLVKDGAQVRAFVKYNSTNDWGWLENSPVKNDVEIHSGDIRDFDSVFEAAKGCHEIFHLAALIGIPYSYVSPLAYIRTNVEGTYNVLQAAKHWNTEKVIVTSTSETYGTAQYVPIDEAHPAVGQSPYAATKVGADQLALSFHKSFQMPVWVVRPFNTYGPRQSARAVIPTIISQLLAGKNEIQLGDIEPTRDFTFVKDTAEGFLKIAASNALMGDATNIGTNSEISIGNLVNTIAKIIGCSVKIQTDKARIRPANSEVERLWCENKKLYDATKWKPETTLEDGLRETVLWIKENKNVYKHDLYNV